MDPRRLRFYSGGGGDGSVSGGGGVRLVRSSGPLLPFRHTIPNFISLVPPTPLCLLPRDRLDGLVLLTTLFPYVSVLDFLGLLLATPSLRVVSPVGRVSDLRHFSFLVSSVIPSFNLPPQAPQPLLLLKFHFDFPLRPCSRVSRTYSTIP